jgi:hypothetical protein
MEVKGTIKVIGETQTFDSGFRKRQIVITTSELYKTDAIFKKYRLRKL